MTIRDKWKARREAAGAKEFTLQVANALAASERSLDWAATLSTVVTEELWRNLPSSRGEPYEDFGAYACDKSPYGLGVRDDRKAKLLKTALVMTGHIPAWITMLERIARPRGRPPKNSALSDNFEPFYTLQRSATTTDQIYLALHRGSHYDLLALINTGELSAKQAAIKAGILHASSSSQGPFCDVRRFQTMSVPAQAKWAGRMFSAMPLQAQCIFIERQLGPHGKGLAAEWANRDASKPGARP